MSEAAADLRRLTARVEEASAALRGARFDAFAAAAADLEGIEPPNMPEADLEAREACRELRGALDRMAALMGHVAGVQLALRGLDATPAALYDRTGSGVEDGRARLQREA